MSHISLPTLAKRLGLSRRNLQRLAASGLIPDASRTAGGHWIVKKSARLEGWISRQQMDRTLRFSVGGSTTAPLISSIIDCEKRIDALLFEGKGKPSPAVIALLERLAQTASTAAAVLGAHAACEGGE